MLLPSLNPVLVPCSPLHSCVSVPRRLAATPAVALRSASLLLASWLAVYLQKLGALLASYSVVPCPVAETLRRRCHNAMAPVVNSSATFPHADDAPADVDNNKVASASSTQEKSRRISTTQGGLLTNNKII